MNRPSTTAAGTTVADFPATQASAPAHHAGAAGLLLAALGIVFGDIGTSPLCALRGVVDVPGASYFLSRGPIRRTSAPGMARWRKALFVTLARKAADPAAYFGLPADRTVTMGSDVNL